MLYICDANFLTTQIVEICESQQKLFSGEIIKKKYIHMYIYCKSEYEVWNCSLTR